ncbi:iron-containing alcohol dehydrogenase [Bhargavaea ginsengi]|uniref:iron-containing alcohol dehydrogenase n=1 Tax=Bhargavaea ginsengi TaxID=426757 RepID=UPI00203AADA6|nr:iron-containing alcohol dehydrogenase [Bhargavaea ginsengi]MCM3087674.1 iron-containing alcohol dehydrogenase [Bhargavaea ginsengi]
MNTFTFQNPTKLIFGEGQIETLKAELPQFGNKVLLVYGGGSIKRNGVYDDVMGVLGEIGAEVHELSGVEPNPRVSTAAKGAAICKEQDIDIVLAVGGGSVIDCSKLIASAAKYDGDAWDLVTRKAVAEDALPIGVVLTIAATGSEMNAGSVITNEDTQEKYGWGGPLNFPRFSILDPAYTKSVPEDQTVYGIVDMMSHIFEQYFNNAVNTPVQDEMCEGVLRAIIRTAPELLADMENTELRGTIMFAGTIALNKFLEMGYRGDWGTHNIEHAVSAIYDIPHAGGLAILFPEWMKFNIQKGTRPERFAQLAINVFGVDPEGKTTEETALEGVERLRSFWSSLGAPERLADYKIDDTNIGLMADKSYAGTPVGQFAALEKDEIETILKNSL